MTRTQIVEMMVQLDRLLERALYSAFVIAVLTTGFTLGITVFSSNTPCSFNITSFVISLLF